MVARFRSFLGRNTKSFKSALRKPRSFGQWAAYGACSVAMMAAAVLAPLAVHAHMADPNNTQTLPNEVIVVPNSNGVSTVRSNTPTITKQQVQLFTCVFR